VPIFFAFKLVIAVSVVLFLIGLVIGLTSWTVAEVKLRRHDRQLANRWRENADPFIGAP
jgi:hypothetical protein